MDNYQWTTEKRPAYNSGLAKVAVSVSTDSFVVNQTLVLRINICGENRHLRQAANRWTKFAPQRQFARLQRSSNCLILSNGSALPHAFCKLYSVANFVQLRVCKMPLVCSHAFFKQV